MCLISTISLDVVYVWSASSVINQSSCAFLASQSKLRRKKIALTQVRGEVMAVYVFVGEKVRKQKQKQTLLRT